MTQPSNCFTAFRNGAAVELCWNATTMQLEPGSSDGVPSPMADVDVMWIILCGALVFFMQTGFGMLEAGCVREKNVVNILFKNAMDAAIAAVVFAAVGYGFAYGEKGNAFIGAGNFFLTDFSVAEAGFHNFFFQWTFSAAAATIVAGSVAERCSLGAYFIYSLILTAVIYPVVVHWIWASDGWLSAFNEAPATMDCCGGGMIDFAGSGVVHITGGISGLIAATIIRPRTGRFTGGESFEPHSHVLAALGCLILWFGWYGFNCGSTLAVSTGASTLASRVATTTTLAAAAGGITACFVGRVLPPRKYDIMGVLNGILAGLVSITAGCPVVGPGSALLIGVIGCCVYKSGSTLLTKLKIDDPLDAAPVHGFCGIWGCLAVGIFATEQNKELAAYRATDGTFGIQIIGVLAIIAWILVTITPVFLAMRVAGILRVDADAEEKGLDHAEHSVQHGSKNRYTSVDPADSSVKAGQQADSVAATVTADVKA